MASQQDNANSQDVDDCLSNLCSWLKDSPPIQCNNNDQILLDMLENWQPHLMFANQGACVNSLRKATERFNNDPPHVENNNSSLKTNEQTLKAPVVAAKAAESTEPLNEIKIKDRSIHDVNAFKVSETSDATHTQKLHEHSTDQDHEHVHKTVTPSAIPKWRQAQTATNGDHVVHVTDSTQEVPKWTTTERSFNDDLEWINNNNEGSRLTITQYISTNIKRRDTQEVKRCAMHLEMDPTDDNDLTRALDDNIEEVQRNQVKLMKKNFTFLEDGHPVRLGQLHVINMNREIQGHKPLKFSLNYLSTNLPRSRSIDARGKSNALALQRFRGGAFHKSNENLAGPQNNGFHETYRARPRRRNDQLWPATNGSFRKLNVE